MFFEFMMHGLHPLGLSSVSVLSNHPICGGEPKFYQEADGYLGLIMAWRHLWWIWTLAHIMIFSNYIILNIGQVYYFSSFLPGKVFALVFGLLFSIQLLGRVVSGTISVSWHAQSAAEISCFCIYQIDYLAHLTTIWDTDRRSFRNSIEVSDRYIFQCYSIWGNGDRDEILQLRHLTSDPNVSKQFVERSVAKQGAVSAWSRHIWWFVV